MKMSRSKKRTPVAGMTSAPSEQEDKRLYNRRYRHVCKQVLHVNPMCDLLPHLRQYSNPWAMAKDGKKRFDPQEWPKWLRK